MQRKFVTNLALVLLLNLLIKPFWILGIDRVVQNTVGTEQYGFYYAIFNFSFLLNILLDLGITNFNNRNIAQNNHLLSKHFASIVMLRLLLAFIFTIITLIGGLIIGYTDDMMKMLIAVIFNQILLGFIMYLRSNLAGMHLFRTDSIISVLDRLIMIVICLFLLRTYANSGTFEIQWFVYAQTAAYLLTVVITLALVMDKTKVKRFHWRWPFFLMILKKSYPYAVLVLLMTFYNRIDSVMLERMLPFRVGALEAGIYASAYRLLDSANQIALLFAGLLLPIFSRMIKLKQNVEEILRLSVSLLIIPAFIIYISCYFYSYELMDLLYSGDHISESAQVFQILMACFIPISATYIFGTLLTANGNLKQLNIMASVGMLLNIVLNLILIPKLSSVGAAYSSITTQAFTALVQILMVQSVFQFKTNFSFLLRSFLFILSCILLNSIIVKLEVFWMYKFIFGASISFLVAILFRLIRLRNLYRIIKYDQV